LQQGIIAQQKSKFLSLWRRNSDGKTQIFGAMLVGPLSVVAQIAVYCVRFGE
jgi:hypothetical protein